MLEEILQEISIALKETYIDIANNYSVKELHYDDDKVACVAGAFRDEAVRRIESIIPNHGDNGWIPCSRELPENEQEVEITYAWKHPDGRRFYGTARAFHTDGTVTVGDSGYNWEDTDDWEYCAEKDDVYIPEGWWECVAFGETFSAVDQEVIAWKPCPKPYRPEQKDIGEDYKNQIMNRFLKME